MVSEKLTLITNSNATFPARRLRTALALATAITTAGFLAACQDSEGLRSGRANKPIPAETLALMNEKGMTKHSPILLRAFKKEAELEIWKMKADGQYALLKTYPMCRWSGQLGPKRREGDRQVPEGFYAITPNRMNPNSAYYLSFDVGYPNAYDRAQGNTGALIMVHGDCSSAGCFSMTDEQIAEIYAVAREAFSGGQSAIQMQSMPFRMTPENLAKHRFDPHMKFWRQIKEGSDHFEVTHREPQVAVCGNRYVFNSKPKDSSTRLDARAACPPLEQEESLRNMVAEKNHREQQKVAELVSKGTPAVKVVYADGGQHPSFRHISRVSRPETVDRGPVEIAIDESGKPLKTPILIAGKTDAGTPAAAPTASTPAPTAAIAAKPSDPAASLRQTTTVAQTGSNLPAAKVGGTAAGQPPTSASAYAPPTPETPPAATETPFYSRWLGGAAQPEVPAAAPAAPVQTPAAASTTAAGKRAEGEKGKKPVPARDKQANTNPLLMRGALPALPQNLMAYSPFR